MDKIIISGLKIFAYHGVNPEEKRDGQNFVIDIELDAELDNARMSDNLADTVNYAAVIKSAKAAFTEKSYDLIEAAGQSIISRVLADYAAVKAITVTVKKPEAPISSEVEYVAVKLSSAR